MHKDVHIKIYIYKLSKMLYCLKLLKSNCDKIIIQTQVKKENIFFTNNINLYLQALNWPIDFISGYLQMCSLLHLKIVTLNY